MVLKHKVFLGAVLADLPLRVVGSPLQIPESLCDITGRGLTSGMRM